MRKRGLYLTVKVDRKGFSAVLLLIGACLGALFTARAATLPERVELPVIMYHALLEDESRHGQYVVSPEEFESDLLWLEQHGYTTVLPSQLLAYAGGGDLPEKPVLLTFDDGYYNNYLYAFPLAQKHGAKFLLSPIGRWADHYTETGEHNAYYTHAVWEQLREMTDSGLVELGNHSYDLHSAQGRVGVQKRSGETEEEYAALLKADLLKAQNAIEAHTGKRPEVFVYPFGAVSPATPEIVRELGFSMTLTCEEKVGRITRDPSSLYGLGRFLRPSGMSSEEFFSGRLGLK